jgi:Glycosyl transferase family 2
MSESLPTVSVLMGAYNYEQYVGRAIESALEQEYPPDRLELIVVDDGSTDGTAAVVADLAKRHPGRIRLIRQANGGATAATNRALVEATGDLICLLDADDVWLPQKTRRQVEMLIERPELGMVFSDMFVVDAEERITQSSHAWGVGTIPQRPYARVLAANVATQSSIMIRASLRPQFAPIPSVIPYADWWFSLSAARVSEVDYIREPLALYRQHGSNLTGGVTGASAVREHRKEVFFQLWCLRHLPLDPLTPDDLLYVWSWVETHASMGVEAAGSYFVEPVDLEFDAERADGCLRDSDHLRTAGDLGGATRLALQALAWDPYRPGAAEHFKTVARDAQAAAARPHPLAGARRFVVLVDAEELLASDGMMLAYAEALGGSELVTLAVDSTRLPAEVAGRGLRALVERCGLGSRDDLDLLAVLGPCDEAQRWRMRSGAHAYYSAAPQERDLPVFTPEALDRLLSYAERSASPSGRDAQHSLA